MTMCIPRHVLLAFALVASSAPAGSAAEAESSRGKVAERYFRGVYGCNPGVVEELAATDIVVTYPIFEDLFGAPVLRGRDAVKAFADHFCRKWADAELVFHETISDERRVVLVWSFSARDTEAVASDPRSAWGGISLLKFNPEGKIAAEIGEESTPGPMGRLAKANDE